MPAVLWQHIYFLHSSTNLLKYEILLVMYYETVYDGNPTILLIRIF